MTTVFHRAPRLPLPSQATASRSSIRPANAISTRAAARPFRVLAISNQRVIDAIKRQAQQLAYAHTSFFTTDVAEELADRLVDAAPAGLEHVYFVSGGSEAVEAALKLARQYFVEKGEPQRRHFIARRQSYHGNTLGALAIGGNAWRREPFLPLLIEAHHVSRVMRTATSRRGNRRSVCATPRGRTRAKDRRTRRGKRRGVRRGNGGGRNGRRGAAGAHVPEEDSRGVRQVRRAADPRRDHVGDGAHGLPVCVR